MNFRIGDQLRTLASNPAAWRVHSSWLERNNEDLDMNVLRFDGKLEVNDDFGFNFGAPGTELYVDGQLATRTGDPRVETVVPECGGTTTDGIAGNEQPWVLGYDTSRSGDALDGLIQHFDQGCLDAFSISAARRDFQAP